MRKKRTGRSLSPAIGVWAVGLACVFIAGIWFWPRSRSGSEWSIRKPSVTKPGLAHALGMLKRYESYPSEVDLEVDGKLQRVVVQYAFEPQLQEQMETLFKTYHPDFGAFVAIDPATGRVLSMVSYAEDQQLADNLALRATFPSASVFKMVTAAAAISEKSYSAETVIPFDGRNHTLYRRNVLKTAHNRWTRHITLRDAFAHSVNTVFAKIGALVVGPEALARYAERFGYNRPIPADVPVQEGRAPIENGDVWSVAETASGYTRETTMSPLQGAMMAATIANDGQAMEPFAVQSVHALDGSPLYQAVPTGAGQAVPPAVAEEVRKLMRETVTGGTSRRSFRGFFRGDLAHLDVGGKTGSLTGQDPVGKYDWFVGYASDGKQRIAVAALTVHRKFWRVKSSHLARVAFENHFRGQWKESIQEARLSPAVVR